MVTFVNTRVVSANLSATVLDMSETGWRQKLIAQQVDHHMTAAGILTVTELATRSHIGRTVLTQVLSGTRPPSWKTIGAIASALHVHPNQIATWEHVTC